MGLTLAAILYDRVSGDTWNAKTHHLRPRHIISQASQQVLEVKFVNTCRAVKCLIGTETDQSLDPRLYPEQLVRRESWQ